MADSGDFDVFATRVKEVAQGVGALTIDAFLDISDRSGVPQAALSLDEFLRAVQRVKPQLVYLVETDFELGTEIERSNEALLHNNDENDEDRECLPDALDTLAKKWRRFDGKPCLAFAAIMVDGAMLTSASRPSWRELFDTDLEAVEEEISTLRESERYDLEQRDSAEVREKSTMLANHPSFNAGRTSFDKRMFLAEHLFPDVDLKTLHAITRRAENIDWLTRSGFKA
ncbi:MAG: hypothetical protein KGO02_02170 [Alphaproteobacteria bacterium]|nr:hypothetical protein [Alphaproteobacteria bacterium]